MDPKATLNFSQLERDYNLFKLLENRVFNKSGKEYFAAKAKNKNHHRSGKAILNRCSMCKHLKLDPNWERTGLEPDWRNICSNEKSLSFEMHVNFQESCGKFEKNLEWKRWSYKK